MKKNWRHHNSHLVSLIDDYQEMEDDKKVPCLEAIAAVRVAGCDDKSSVNVGFDLPLEATPRQSNRAIVQPGTSMEAADHDFTHTRVVPSVIHLMNQSTYPGDSLYSGGPDGTGCTFVSVHDATLDPSSGMKNAAHFNQFLLRLAREHDAGREISAEEIDSLAYLVLIECDGGPDHNLTFLSNQLALFGLFLVGKMDKLTTTRGCPGLSYLLTAERAMSNLNRGLSSLALRLDPNMPQWLRDILASVNSMKGTRNAIAEYDDISAHAIDTLERRLARLSVVVATSDDNIENAVVTTDQNDASGAKVGDRVRKFFAYYGWFMGEVLQINPDAEDAKFIRVKYDDGDIEDMTQADFDSLLEQANIPIDAIGSRFIKKFGRYYFNGEVIRILGDEKRICRFNDGEHHSYSLAKLEKFSKERNDDGVDLDDDDDSIDDDDNCEANAEDAVDPMDDDVVVSANPEPVEVLAGRLLQKLTRVPFDKSLDEHLQDLKDRPSAREAWTSAIAYPKRFIDDRFGRLELEGRPVEVMEYADDEHTKIIVDALKKWGWDSKYKSKSQLSKMPEIEEFFNSPEHCRKTDFSFELRLCGVVGCRLCAKIRSVRTPDVDVNGYNLRQEVLR